MGWVIGVGICAELEVFLCFGAGASNASAEFEDGIDGSAMHSDGLCVATTPAHSTKVSFVRSLS